MIRGDGPNDEGNEMAYVTSHRTAGSAPVDLLGNILSRLQDARARRAIYVRTIRELDSMTDRDLADINVSRLQIRDIAREAAYGK